MLTAVLWNYKNNDRKTPKTISAPKRQRKKIWELNRNYFNKQKEKEKWPILIFDNNIQ